MWQGIYLETKETKRTYSELVAHLWFYTLLDWPLRWASLSALQPYSYSSSCSPYTYLVRIKQHFYSWPRFICEKAVLYILTSSKSKLLFPVLTASVYFLEKWIKYARDFNILPGDSQQEPLWNFRVTLVAFWDHWKMSWKSCLKCRILPPRSY